MSYLIKPKNYKPLLDLKQTELGIKQIKEFFQLNLSSELRLRRVTAPLFVLKGMGINDDLNGIERPVSFPIKDLGDAQAEVVHSLAKWKRLTLADYNIEPAESPKIKKAIEYYYAEISTRKPSLALCRPMGLGTRHHQRRQKRRIPERDRKPYLRSHDPHRIHGIRNVSSDQTLSATEVTFHPFGRIAPALSEP